MTSALQNNKKLIGQHFIVGFPDYSVPAEFQQLVEEYHLAGTIYFKRNVQSPAQLAELSNDLQFRIRPKEAPPLFVSIDHEGGKVNRLVKPFTKFPGINHLGDIHSPKIGFLFGLVLGKELRAVGVNINFAPVLDVLTHPENSLMRTRSFSNDPEICARMGSAVCRGIQKMNVMAVGKHFPGHGGVKEDSHFKLPKTSRTKEELNELELIPFVKAIRSRIEGIMTAHVLNSELDDQYPATLSKTTVSGLLREELRYPKMIFTDDMEMKAVTSHYGAGEAGVLALAAGNDLLVYRGDEGAHLEALEAAVKALEDGTLSKELLQASEKRILAAKKAYLSSIKPIEITKVGSSIGLPEHFRLADIITKKEIPSEQDGKTLPEIE